MAARELILRFMAFSIRNYESYPRNSDMDSFLSDAMRIINVMPIGPEDNIQALLKDNRIQNLNVTDIKTLKNRFSDGMKRSYKIFGQHSFRKSYPPKKRSPINKTLFEVWGNLMADLDEDDFQFLLENKKVFLENYNKLLDDQYFGILISRDSWKSVGVNNRYKLLKALLDGHIQR